MPYMIAVSLEMSDEPCIISCLLIQLWDLKMQRKIG